jgi:HEAT repeat protein
VVIKASSGKAVESLLLDLRTGDGATRDLAVARLTIIGARAVPRLVALARDEGADADIRVAAFRALDAIGDPRGLSAARDAASAAEPSVAVAAIAVVRGFLQGPQAIPSLDRLTGLALDTECAAVVRLAAVDALSDLDPETIRPVLAALAADADPAIAAAVNGGAAPETADDSLGPVLARDAVGVLVDDPARVRARLVSTGASMPLTALHQIIEGVRRREQEDPAHQAEWMAARAGAHLALAQRGSRIALYDLRETLETATAPLAVEFVAALTLVGDASCLEPIASAYVRQGAEQGDGWWHRHLKDAFQTIAQRHRLTARHAVMKKIGKRWPQAFASLRGTPA